MFNRNINQELKKWAAQKERKPLILRGARQVGKTTAAELFAREFDQFIHLDLDRPDEAQIFNRDLTIEDLLQAIFLQKNMARTRGRTLLFIDEIQNSPRAIACMKGFYESAKDIHVMAAGSLLETMIDAGKIGFPVGRVQFLFMYPLCFEEFLGALDARQALELYHTVPLPDFAAPKLMELFHKFALLGGMPEVIKTYVETEDLVSLAPVYQGLMTAYFDDVSKYADSDAMARVLQHAIEAAPFEAGSRIKLHGFGKSSYGSREMGEALKMLERAMLIYLLYPTTATAPPIVPDFRKSPRLQFLDTGLINHAVGLQHFFFKSNDLHSFYQGRLAEHIVGQEFMALNLHSPKKISFWVREKKQSNAEVDFVLPYQDLLIPVEVKAGKTGALRSLHQFVDRSEPKFALRLHAGPLELANAITTTGSSFQLLNLPYCLAGKVYNYLDWAPAGTAG